MSAQPDLLTPAMPPELEHALYAARVELHHEAEDINEWLKTFFEDAWAECHQFFTHDTFTIEKGERVESKVTVRGSPDFNEFDRRVGKYAKRLSKLRAQLWDIYEAATVHDETSLASDGQKESEADRG